MTPNDIEVLLHYHCFPRPHPRIEAPAVQDSVRWFVTNGMLRHVSTDVCASGFETTEGGKVLVDALCAVPFPVQRWVMP